MGRLFTLWALAGLAVAGTWCAPPAAGAQADGPGYIREVLAVGNWRDMPADRTLLDADELPFEGRLTLGRLWTVIGARPDGFVDLNALGPTSPETALVHVYVLSEAARTYRLLVGSDDRAHVSLNGRRIHTSTKKGGWKPDQETVNLKLNKGWNRLLLRVESESGAFGFSVRFALPDGRPVTLTTRAAVPDDWLDRPQLKRPLSTEGVGELLELLNSRITSVARQASRMVADWKAEGDSLDPSYARARDHASAYVETLQRVLETLPAAENEAEEAKRRQAAEEARGQLEEQALGGPYQLADRTRAFLDRARRGARLWEMVRFAASTVYEAGRQAAEVDRALVEARALLAGVTGEYLRPYTLREETLRHRTAAVTLRLADRNHSPLAGAEVSVEQLSHAFLFGCNLFAYGAFDSDDDERRYLDSFTRLFNLAVVPFYWSLTEPVEGQANYAKDVRGLPGPEPMVRWCRERGLAVMGVPLVSNTARPPWLVSKSPEETAAIVEAHVRDVAGRFKGQVDYWDATPGAWPTLAFSRLRMPATYAFAWAAEADPGAQLLVSHYAAWTLCAATRQNDRQPFALAGVILDARQADGAWPPAELEAHLDRLTRYGAVVHLGRVMIPGAPKDEALQAREVEAFYRTAFATPCVMSVTWWDLSDRFAHRGAPGGLLRRDLTPKPAYHALARLIRDEWWTSADGRCGPDGQFTFRGTLGRYRVRATLDDGSVGVWEIRVAADGPPRIDLVYPPEAPSAPPQP